MPLWIPRAPMIALLVSLTYSSAALAGKIEVTDVSLPVPFVLASLSAGGTQTRLDDKLEASAVEPIGDGRLLLVAHDKAADLLVVEAETGRIIGLANGAGFPAAARTDPKWEGMAHDERGFFYLIGSHSGTPEERINRSFLLQFRLSGGGSGQPWRIDASSVRRWDVGQPLTAALREEGLDAASVDRMKFEGLAVRSRSAAGGSDRHELIIGLREPDDLVRGFAADITNAPLSDSNLSMKRLFALEPTVREGCRSQLTSLLDVAAWSGLLIVTATEDEHNVFHGNTLWFLPDDQLGHSRLAKPQELWVFEPAMKAEGLCLLPTSADKMVRSLRLAITYDNDAKKTQIPSRLQFITLIRHEP